jgi:hypothetical protein
MLVLQSEIPKYENSQTHRAVIRVITGSIQQVFKNLYSIIVSRGMIWRFDPMLPSIAVPEFFSVKRTWHKAKMFTAASSGLNAPLAMLCLPALSLWLLFAMVDLADPSLLASRARHSSSVAGWP